MMSRAAEEIAERIQSQQGKSQVSFPMFKKKDDKLQSSCKWKTLGGFGFNFF